MASAELPSLGSSTRHTAALGGQCWLQSPAINGRHCASLESREAGPGWVQNPGLPCPSRACQGARLCLLPTFFWEGASRGVGVTSYPRP